MPQTHVRGAADPAPLSVSRRLLVVMPSWVGDCVMATPLLRAVRRLCTADDGGAFLAAYLRPHLATLFDASGLFDELIAGRPAGLPGPVREAARLGGFAFDTALLLPNSFRAALTVRLAGIPRRIGYDRDRRGRLLTDPVSCPMPGGWHQPMPLIDYYLALAAPFGVDAGDDRAPRVRPAAGELEKARELLAAAGMTQSRPIALLNPGASKAAKRWPAERFAVLADRLHEDFDMQVMVNGSPAERALTREVADRVRRARVLDLGQSGIGLATLAALCAFADLVVTNDTGTRHIAAAVGFDCKRRGDPAPAVVTIFGTVRPEWTTLDYGRERELFDRDAGRVDAIGLDEVCDACRQALAAAA